MSDWQHKWTYHIRLRIQDAYSDALAVLISIEQGGFVYDDSLGQIDDAIQVLQEAKALFLSKRDAAERKAA